MANYADDNTTHTSEVSLSLVLQNKKVQLRISFDDLKKT